MRNSDRYPLPAVILHWLIALLIIGMVALGFYMVGIPRNTPERAFFLNLHKSFGVLTFVLVLIRIGWRTTHKVPPLPSSVPLWQMKTSLLSHRLLYVCMVLQPMTGYIGSSFNKYGIKFFGLQLPNWGWEDKGLRELFVSFHKTIAIFLIVLILLHVSAAMKHWLVDKDRVLQRMLP